MADAEYGNVNHTAIAGGDEQKHDICNDNHRLFEAGVAGVVVFDLADSNKTLTEAETQVGAWDFTGALTANRVISVDNTIEKRWWVRDRTTGGFTLTIQPTSETGIQLPKNRWVQVRHDATNITFMGGWDSGLDAGSISWGTNYGDTTGRALRLHKEDGEDGAIGGLVMFEGAVEKSTAPAINDTILTLPQYYRPAFDVGFRVPVNPDITTATPPRGPLVVEFGHNTGFSASQALQGPGLEDLSGTPASLGYRAHRAGWITAISFNVNVTVDGTSGTIDCRVLVNGSNVLSAQIDTTGTGTGWYNAKTVQLPGVDAVAVDDRINCDLNFGTFVGTIDDVIASVEMVTDSPIKATTIEINTSGVVKLRGALPASGETIDLSGVQFFAEN